MPNENENNEGIPVLKGEAVQYYDDRPTDSVSKEVGVGDLLGVLLAEAFSHDEPSLNLKCVLPPENEGNGSLKVIVKNTFNDKPIEKANVELVSQRTKTTDGEGETIFSKLTPGDYTVKASVTIGEATSTAEATAEVIANQMSIIELKLEYPTLEISIILPNDEISFTTKEKENEIKLTAVIKPDSLAVGNNPNIEWELEDDPNEKGATPVPKGISEKKGNQITIKIDIPLQPAGRNWNTLNYRVRAKLNVNGTYIFSEWKTFKQDEIDMLRQQYIDMSKNRVPERSEFINSGSSTYFSLAEGACSCGKHSYHLWSIMNQLDAVRISLGRSMTVNSGYRCPIKNSKTKGSAKESQHMYGKAADINLGDYNGNGYPDRNDWDTLANIARKENASYIEPASLTFHEDIRLGRWVHMDWR